MYFNRDPSPQQQADDFQRCLDAMSERNAAFLNVLSAARTTADIEAIHNDYNKPPWYVCLFQRLSDLSRKTVRLGLSERIFHRNDSEGDEGTEVQIIVDPPFTVHSRQSKHR